MRTLSSHAIEKADKETRPLFVMELDFAAYARMVTRIR